MRLARLTAQYSNACSLTVIFKLNMNYVIEAWKSLSDCDLKHSLATVIAMNREICTFLFIIFAYQILKKTIVLEFQKMIAVNLVN